MRRLLEIALLVFLIAATIANFWTVKQFIDVSGKTVNLNLPRDTRLEQYSFPNLRARKYDSNIIFDQMTKDYGTYQTWIFHFDSDGKKVSGIADVPRSSSPSSSLSSKAAVLMIRGFAEKDQYYPGFGTERVAAELAKEGHVTLAPDFLGYGGSDEPGKNPFEERFQTYTTVLNLLAAVQKINSSGKLGMWAHSNGGQIALSVLAISGRDIPTVLWNPVSKPFPYGILYYTDDWDDSGSLLRRILAVFEQNYDVKKYSYTNFLDQITAPILLQQGSADTQVPASWSRELAAQLKSKNKDITLKIYDGADHNMVPASWNQAVADDLKFFAENLAKP